MKKSGEKKTFDRKFESIVGAGYYADKIGTIYNKNNQKLKTFKNKNGYHYVNFYFDSRRLTVSVHTFVAYLKFGNYKPLEVRHFDGNQENNSWDNILVGTHSENMLDRDPAERIRTAVAAGTTAGKISGAKNGKLSRKLSSGDVDEIKNSTQTYRILAKQYSVSKTVIYNIKNNFSYNETDE